MIKGLGRRWKVFQPLNLHRHRLTSSFTLLSQSMKHTLSCILYAAYSLQHTVCSMFPIQNIEALKVDQYKCSIPGSTLYNDLSTRVYEFSKCLKPIQYAASWFSDLYILFLILPLRIYRHSHRTYSDSEGDKQCFEAIMRLIHHNTFNKDFSARVHHYLDIMRSNGIQLSDLNSRTDQNILRRIDFYARYSKIRQYR